VLDDSTRDMLHLADLLLSIIFSSKPYPQFRPSDSTWPSRRSGTHADHVSWFVQLRW
jgi:hypothetical protein